MNLNIEHIAKLARISLSEAESQKFTKDLDNILGHFDELKKLDTDGITPMAGGTDLKNAFREDIAHELPPEKLRSAFPDSEGEFLKVPKIFD